MSGGLELRVLITTDAVGGVWNYSLDLARGLARLDVSTILAVHGPSPSPAQRQAARSVPGLRTIDTGLPLDWPADGTADLEQAGGVIAMLAATSQVDLVHLNAPSLAACAHFPVPIVAVLHGCAATWWETIHPGEPMPEAIARRTERVRAGLAAANAVATPTAAFGALARRVYGLRAAPHTVHNGRSPIQPSYRSPRDFVFTAGRLWDPGKNLRTLDAAAAGIGVPVHAAGPTQGPDGKRIGFDHLHSLGVLDAAEMETQLASRPLFASTALYAPFGLSALEAASAGCTLILSDVPAFRELWDEVAIFIDPEDPTAFGRACNDLIGDDIERAVMGRAAKERAALFTPDAMAAQMATLYRGLLPAVRRPVLAALAA